MERIKRGGVHMRPRWQFVLTSVLALLGAVITLLVLLYMASLGVFLLRDSGVWFAPAFGPRGWWALLHALPVFVILFVVAFVLLLQYLVHRYELIYKRPLLASLGAIILVVLIGGFLLSQTPLHRQIAFFARGGGAPPPLNMLYSRPPREPGFYRGVIVATTTNGFTMVDPEGEGTTTVTTDRHTQLPDGEDFQIGTEVLVAGDQTPSGIVHAFGVRQIGE